MHSMYVVLYYVVSAIRRYQNTGSSGLSKNDIEKVVRPAMLLIHGFAVRESEHTLHFHVRSLLFSYGIKLL